MRGLRICFLFIVLLFLFLDVFAAPRKRKAVSPKPTLAWVKDNSRLFTIQQAEDINSDICNFKDSLKNLPDIYVVTQNNYSIKSPYFRAIKSSVSDDKWYISEAKEYADDFVILIRPRSPIFATPQLNILCNRNSEAIIPFVSSLKIDRLQNEYAKCLNATPNTSQWEVVKKLVDALRSSFFDGQIRDYSDIITPQDEVAITQLINNFKSSTTYNVAIVTTQNAEGEDSVFGRALVQQKNESQDKQAQWSVEYKNLNADIVFIFYPKGVYVFHLLDKEKLSDKAIQNLISQITLPQAKSGKYKDAIEASLTALSDHLNGEKPLDGMSIWEKLAAVLLGVGIPAAFGWYIFKDSTRKKKANASENPKPVINKSAVEKKASQSRSTKPVARQTLSAKPEKKDERVAAKPNNISTSEVMIKKIAPLKLTKPTESGEDRGWTLDNTGSLPVTMSRIDEVFKPISPRNEHEKVMLEMIDYMRSLREYTDEEIAHSLGNAGVSLYLDELYGCVDPAAVRIVFNRGLDVLIKSYAERDPRVSKYVNGIRH